MNHHTRIYQQEYFSFARHDKQHGRFKTEHLIRAIDEFDRVINIFEKTEIPIKQILGLRNLSAFVGEVFNISVKKVASEEVENNPHQDGYPDLLIMDDFGRNCWNEVKNRLHEKAPFSPFAGGGIEVKATCGDLRSGSWFTKKKIRKPELGETRQNWVTGYNWKAHHRETNNLVGLIWDFLNRKPTIVAILYSNQLNEEDWGKTVTPKQGGGRTTSVSIMNRNGISKMVAGLVSITDDISYRNKLMDRLRKYQ